MENENYKNLLNKYNILYNENEKKKKLGVHDYSLMNALLKKTDEVNLHSNFIYSMINPKGSHYCGTIFLELFLEAINEANFVNLSNARVHKEKGKIDLLIEDGEKVIIIENKLRAVDQQHQISRYIQYVYDKYMDKNTSVDNKVRIVYLSEYKKIPSKDKNSTIGFNKISNQSIELIWQEENDIELCNDTKLSLPKNTRLKFNSVQHSKHLLDWVFLSKNWLSQYKPNNISRGLDYAFDEYKLILKRLDTKKQWRNIMSLDEYTLVIKDEKEQEKMYAFMCEANEKLNDYLCEKLYEDIVQLFPKRETLVFPNKIFDEFTKPSCRKWFKQSGQSKNYRDIGFVFNEKYFFALGKDNISYGLYDKGWNIKTNRKNIQCNRGNNLFTVINDLKKLKDK